MSGPFKSAVAYRYDFCTTIAQLQQRATRPLPDGAMVFVSANRGLFQLYKNLGSSFDNIASSIVVPADQSTNRWVMQEASGASPWSGVEVSTEQNNIAAPGSNIWAALGTAAGAFTLMEGDASMFAVNATSSLLTYHGPARPVLLTSTVAVLTVATDAIRTVLSHNNDVAAGSSADQRLKGEQQASPGDGLAVNITMQRAVTLADGSTIRQMLRSSNGAQELQVNYFTLSVVPR